MRSSYLVIAVVIWVGACATQRLEISSTIVTRWENRDVSELVAAIGPFDTASTQGDSRSYYWFRFGNCRLTVLSSHEEKILKIDAQGTTQGCSAYLQKISDGAAPSAKP